MLRSLQIRNIAVIRSADIEFNDGFTVLTGETGAGKSIIVDSIGLLLGSRATRELLRAGEKRATVTALFDRIGDETAELLNEYGIECEDEVLLISRTINSDGRSSARINSGIVTQAMLREVSRTLLCIHGQHDNQRLMVKSSHIRLLDAYAGLGARLEEYSALYNELRVARSALQEHRSDEAGKARLRDILTNQINEINSAKLKPGEEEKLSVESLRLQNAERIKKHTNYAWRALHGSDKGAVTLLLGKSAAALEQLCDIIPDAEQLAKKLESFKYEIVDIAEELHFLGDFTDGDPTARLDHIEGRLDSISRLKRKYGADISEILKFRDEAENRLDDIDNSEEKISELVTQIAKLESIARSYADEISKIRQTHALRAAEEVCGQLAYLDMPGTRFKIDVQAGGQLKPDGVDQVEFLIATNPGEPLMPFTKIASGGELSRIMLALGCVLAANDGISTMIFDEVDSGISGKTSRKVGIKIREIAKEAQVLCVTHSAQIASLADIHLLISKTEQDGRAETDVSTLNNNGRIDEIARILGGINITETQREAAEEMLNCE